MYHRKRYRVPVDAFALARGAKQPVTSKQEAENVWEPKFIGEIVAGKDPHKAPAPPTPEGMTVAGFLDQYYERYVVAESLRSAASIRSRLGGLKEALGALPIAALERTETIEDFKRAYGATRSITAVNRTLGIPAPRDQLGARSHAGNFQRVTVPPVWREDQDQSRDQA
jgi:hypothetical protein